MPAAGPYPRLSPDPLAPNIPAQPAAPASGYAAPADPYGHEAAPQPSAALTDPTRVDNMPPVPPGYQGAAYPSPGYRGGAYPSPGYPVGPPPKKRHTGLIVGIVVLALVLAGTAAVVGLILAGGGSTSASDNPTTAVVPAPTVTSASPTPTEQAGPLHPGALKSYLLPKPKGATTKPGIGKNNTFTAAQEAKDFQDETWRKNELSVNEFSAGADRAWEKSSSLVEIQLYRFARPAGASAFLSTETSDVTFFTEHAYTTSVKDVTDGQIFYTKKKDKQHNTHAVGLATCGDVAIELYVDTYGTVSTDFVSILLRKQYVKLCP